MDLVISERSWRRENMIKITINGIFKESTKAILKNTKLHLIVESKEKTDLRSNKDCLIISTVPTKKAAALSDNTSSSFKH